MGVLDRGGSEPGVFDIQVARGVAPSRLNEAQPLLPGERLELADPFPTTDGSSYLVLVEAGCGEAPWTAASG